jgi:hypothetical protein
MGAARRTFSPGLFDGTGLRDSDHRTFAKNSGASVLHEACAPNEE